MFPWLQRLKWALLPFLLTGCKGGPTVKVEGCYVDANGREYCVAVEVDPQDEKAPLPADLKLKTEK